MSEEQTREIQVIEASPMSVAGSMAQMLATMSQQEFTERLAVLKRSQQRMKQIQRELMEEGIDYGKIPGTGDKPTLLKAGSETLLQFYQLVPTFETNLERNDGVAAPHIRYHVKCQLHVSSADGPVVGCGEGAANSSERKYRYRTAQRACPKCGAIGTVKKSKYNPEWYCHDKAGGCGAKFPENDPQITQQQRGMVENPDPDDVDNTLLKMAEKRAQIDATLRTTATSGLFTQDVEDMEQFNPSVPSEEPASASSPAPATRSDSQPRPANKEQLAAIARMGGQLGYTKEQLRTACQQIYQHDPEQLTFAEAVDWLKTLQVDLQAKA